MYAMSGYTPRFLRGEKNPQPPTERKFRDSFEGFVTKSVNSQLIKDSHRAEWSIDGRGFSFARWNSPTEQGYVRQSSPTSPNYGRRVHQLQADTGNNSSTSSTESVKDEATVEKIEEFQRYFVTHLEEYLLNFCRVNGLKGGEGSSGTSSNGMAKQKPPEEAPSGTETDYLIRCVTTQLCQAGLANLDRGSYANR